MVKKEKIKILFVCTGNIFRSVSNHYCLKDYLIKHKINDIEVASAGVDTHEKNSFPESIYGTLKKWGINADKHKQQQINKKIYEWADLIIVMTPLQKKIIEKKFGKRHVVLYKDILYGKTLTLKDVNEEVPNYKIKKKQAYKYEKNVVTYIHNHTKLLYKRLRKYILFRGFVVGAYDHGKNLPFIPLYETKNTLAFMSIDIPEKEDGHILVIPKKLYTSFDYLPKELLTELMTTVQKIGKVLTKSHGGYNLLLNEGRTTPHSNNHIHFHLIPRRRDDLIIVEGWRRMHLNRKKFLELNKEMKKDIHKELS